MSDFTFNLGRMIIEGIMVPKIIHGLTGFAEEFSYAFEF
jgi:hypothetical protein